MSVTRSACGAAVGMVLVSMCSLGVTQAANAALPTQPTGGAAARIDEYIPESAPTPANIAPTSAAAVTLSVDDSGAFSGSVVDSSSAPVAGAVVDVVATSQTDPEISVRVTANDHGNFAGSLPLPSGTFKVVASSDGTSSTPVVVTRSPALDVSVVMPVVQSDALVPIAISLRDHGIFANGSIVVSVKEPTDPARVIFRGSTTAGQLRIQYRPWRSPVLTVTAVRSGRVARTAKTITTRAPFVPASQPANAPQPRLRFPVVYRPVGVGAAPAITRIPGDIWRSMRGRSWRPGCTSYSSLRLLRVNYRGFDGYRHRGAIVVHGAIARRAAGLFSDLYRIGFHIRQMRPVDAYGPMRGRPGANDYASMAADNTSAFNCRYVVGKESSRVRSPHSSGRSLDINPWENPYVARTGVYPNSWFLWRDAPSSAMWKSGSTQLAMARRARCSWGGSYSDYHHFDC